MSKYVSNRGCRDGQRSFDPNNVSGDEARAEADQRRLLRGVCVHVLQWFPDNGGAIASLPPPSLSPCSDTLPIRLPPRTIYLHVGFGQSHLTDTDPRQGTFKEPNCPELG